MLVRIERCGVCHSDLHLQDGYFSLDGDKKLDVSAGRTLPFTLGHEIAGVIESVGADAAIIGRCVAVYPWIGCGICAACVGGERICARTIATSASPSTAALLPTFWFRISATCLITRRCPRTSPGRSCAGAYRFRRAQTSYEPPRARPILLIGLGGVGMMGLAIARALFTTPPIVADIDAQKCKAALAAGAAQAYDPSDPQARKAVIAGTRGGLLAICDFVGSDKSLQFATGLLARGGKVVVTGDPRRRLPPSLPPCSASRR